jgi:hypothetical protein
MRAQEETLFAPPKEKPIPFRCNLNATSEHKAVIEDAYDPTGKKIPVLSKERITVILDRPTQLLVNDRMEKVYSPKVPDDVPIPVEIIDEENPQKGVHGYIQKGRFNLKIPEKGIANQQTLSEPEEADDDIPF